VPSGTPEDIPATASAHVDPLYTGTTSILPERMAISAPEGVFYLCAGDFTLLGRENGGRSILVLLRRGREGTSQPALCCTPLEHIALPTIYKVELTLIQQREIFSDPLLSAAQPETKNTPCSNLLSTTICLSSSDTPILPPPQLFG
jgi:hypothetical protein